LNQKVKKIIGEIDKTKAKIVDYQGRLRELERQKTELENADIVAMARSIDMPPDQFAEAISAFMAQRGSGVLPKLESRATDTEETKEDSTVEN
jgi:hypothetical protein